MIPIWKHGRREDAFLSRIEDTISRSLQSYSPVSLGGILQLMQSAQPAAALVSEETRRTFQLRWILQTAFEITFLDFTTMLVAIQSVFATKLAILRMRKTIYHQFCRELVSV